MATDSFTPIQNFHLINENVLHIHDICQIESIYDAVNNINPRYIISDHWASVSLENLEIYCAPLWLANLLKELNPTTLLDPATNYTFNFMINKKRAPRYLCIKFVEMFGLTNYDYTWSGAGAYFDTTTCNEGLDRLITANLLTEHQKWELGEPPKLAPKFTFPENRRDNYNDNDTGIDYFAPNLTQRGDANWLWDHAGLKEMFNGSVISLITETSEFEKSAAFTEKTAFPILGLSLPIWIGGYKQAECWKSIGFDIFDDIIDHSYQYYPTLVERCFYAFNNNLKLLTDYKYAKNLRSQLMPRLKNNRHLLLNNQLEQYVQKTIASWPTEIQNCIPIIIKKYYPNLNLQI